ncbi:venom toxin OcyC11-like isoform X1 [Diabrotica virgifera virgifera]|uniref:Single domain-containing protein n=1 Tax=Diabrotica virgifera virgifera TaxID=50390 RepID=A0ABM5JN40_DIAVI|nr:venom toxin OcyC11-like isoform X1 [Diabrotica virgifera virgifera]
MMSKVFIFVICLSVTLANESETVSQCPTFHGLELKAGESKPVPGSCNLAVCNNDGSVYMKICATIQALPPCKLVDGDNTKLYPACCPKAWCPQSFWDDIKKLTNP